MQDSRVEVSAGEEVTPQLTGTGLAGGAISERWMLDAMLNASGGVGAVDSTQGEAAVTRGRGRDRTKRYKGPVQDSAQFLSAEPGPQCNRARIAQGAILEGGPKDATEFIKVETPSGSSLADEIEGVSAQLSAQTLADLGGETRQHGDSVCNESLCSAITPPDPKMSVWNRLIPVIGAVGGPKLNAVGIAVRKDSSPVTKQRLHAELEDGEDPRDQAAYVLRMRQWNAYLSSPIGLAHYERDIEFGERRGDLAKLWVQFCNEPEYLAELKAQLSVEKTDPDYYPGRPLLSTDGVYRPCSVRDREVEDYREAMREMKAVDAMVAEAEQAKVTNESVNQWFDSAGPEAPVPEDKWKEVVNATTPQSLVSWSWERCLGWLSFRNRRQEELNLALSKALYIGADVIDGDHIAVEPEVTFKEHLLQKLDAKLGARKHNVRHRAVRKFNARVLIIKTLVQILKGEAPFDFKNTEADKRALRLVAIRVVTEACKEGVEVLGKKHTIHRHEKNGYVVGVCSAYFVKDEDDLFWEKFASEADNMKA